MDEDREVVNKRQPLPKETPATVQDAKITKNGKVLKFEAQINAFIDAELPYSVIDDVVNISLFPEGTMVCIPWYEAEDKKKTACKVIGCRLLRYT